MDRTECTTQLELFEVSRQQVTLDYEGEGIVTDAGLLPVAKLDRELGILAEAASRLPDPRTQEFVTHSAEQILRQQVYQILAGYPDGNDAQLLRNDPLFKTLVGVDPRLENRPLASGSTINRFQHAFTRREAEKPIEDRDVLFEVRRAQIERINGLNEFLIDAFVRTRKQMPKRVIIDLDPTDDTAHGKQQLTFWHGYYDQNQYFPMMIFEGGTGMPLAAWLRPGTVHASCGAVDMLKLIVDRLRQHWPDLVISVRGDSGVAGPEMYDYCEAEGFEYAFGYATNDTLVRRVKELELEENAKLLWWMTGRRGFQLFHTFDDYQAGSWPHARRIITKVEFTKLGGLNATANVRFVVTNMSGISKDIYHGYYTQRGRVPERPIGELKNGLHMDRLSSHRFLANGHKLMVHMLAYLLYALFREAQCEAAKQCSAETAADEKSRLKELSKMEIGTARVRLFKVGAQVKATHRRIWFHVASHWPGRDLLTTAIRSVTEHVQALHDCWRRLALFVSAEELVRRMCLSAAPAKTEFAPLPLK
ncbi:MAG: IS1380 family transposase [Planctomycetaceae bacterium]